MKLIMPIEMMTAQMTVPLPGWFIHFIGVAEVAGALGLIAFAIVAISRDVAGDPDDGLTPDPSFPLPAPEQEPLAPAPPNTPAPRQPFTLYEPGPPGSVWSYEQLTAEEREVVDLGHDVSGQRNQSVCLFFHR